MASTSGPSNQPAPQPLAVPTVAAKSGSKRQAPDPVVTSEQVQAVATLAASWQREALSIQAKLRNSAADDPRHIAPEAVAALAKLVTALGKRGSNHLGHFGRGATLTQATEACKQVIRSLKNLNKETNPSKYKSVSANAKNEWNEAYWYLGFFVKGKSWTGGSGDPVRYLGLAEGLVDPNTREKKPFEEQPAAQGGGGGGGVGGLVRRATQDLAAAVVPGKKTASGGAGGGDGGNVPAPGGLIRRMTGKMGKAGKTNDGANLSGGEGLGFGMKALTSALGGKKNRKRRKGKDAEEVPVGGSATPPPRLSSDSQTVGMEMQAMGCKPSRASLKKKKSQDNVAV